MNILQIIYIILQVVTNFYPNDFAPPSKPFRDGKIAENGQGSRQTCACKNSNSGYTRRTNLAGPWPGHIYKIRDLETKRQITLVNGELKLAEDLGAQGGYHWLCVETDGYLGFRSPTNNVHIGHDCWGNFVAREYHHWAWEFFNTRAHPKGGQMLLTTHYNTMRKMVVERGTGRLVETDDTGTAWEFIEVHT
ncbi:hypothetical protein F5Y11DRAFT_326266 [Daldinia sp. FL1419]|nr:hypothetical protein F5Y11DRAFT_326266 [Daldinia sp. FL1419]